MRVYHSVKKDRLPYRKWFKVRDSGPPRPPFPLPKNEVCILLIPTKHSSPGSHKLSIDFILEVVIFILKTQISRNNDEMQCLTMLLEI